jgi:hypothetical protein
MGFIIIGGCLGVRFLPFCKYGPNLCFIRIESDEFCAYKPVKTDSKIPSVINFSS